MFQWKIFVLLFVFTAGQLLCQALPESIHPYSNECNEETRMTQPGAIAMEVTFSSETSVEKGQDFIILTDGDGNTIGQYTGDDLAGQTIHVSGDTVSIRLVSDDSKNDYGYKVSSVRNISYREYFATAEVDYTRADKLFNRDLKSELYNQVKNHVSLGYDKARGKMFGEIDNENGYVKCVYTARSLKTSGIPDGNNMNTEHTWPKSLGAEKEPAKSDLHHLFPTDSETNSRRSSYPFGMVVTMVWSKGGSVLGKNEKSQTVFMPREEHRGDVARALFYFSIRYNLSIANDYEVVLKKWHTEDPVDSKEIARNEAISRYQKNRNPFIDHPEYVTRIEDF
ncbi:MAG: endonuclease [Candidatus Brocadiae bacterium]|nr:endonuclease [Candidatus Brocadiia bacterium]